MMYFFPQDRSALMKVLFRTAVKRGDFLKALSYWQEWKFLQNNPGQTAPLVPPEGTA